MKPFEQWRVFSDNIPVSLARSIALPASISTLLLVKRKLSPEIAFAWVVFGISILQFSILSEVDSAGSPRIHGNWGWATIPSTFILFIFSGKGYLSFQIEGGATLQALKREPSFWLIALFGLLHLLSGFLYLGAFLTNNWGIL
jgi:hypothetical protein